jgi:hypothetical protein
MSYDTQTARRYRERATRLGSLAAEYEASETADKLLGVAKDYERMARAREGGGVAGLKT